MTLRRGYKILRVAEGGVILISDKWKERLRKI